MRLISALIATTVLLNGQTTTSLSVSANPAVLGQSVTLTATVSPPATGVVEFLDGFEIVGTAMLNSASIATLPHRFQTSKTHRLRAIHAATANSSTLLNVSVRGLLTRSFGPEIVPPGEIFVDLNGDGNPDGLRTNGVRLGNGAGNFGTLIPREFFFIGAVADFNGDGKPDIIGAATIAPGNGDGTFGPRQPAPQGGSSGAKGFDLNRDGRPDLLGSGLHPSLNIKRSSYAFGLGGTQFTAPTVLIHDIRELADFNGNATVDVLSDEQPAVPGRGFQTLLDLSTAVSNLGIEPNYGLALGDINGDGLDDVVTNRTTVPNSRFEIVVQLSNPAGGFLSPVVVNSASPWVAQQIVDWNGDGKADILLANWQSSPSGALGYLAGRGDGTFDAVVEIAGIVFTSTYRANALELNGDGFTDLLITQITGASSLYLGSPAAPLPVLLTAPVSIEPATATGSGGSFFVRFDSALIGRATVPGVSRAYVPFSGAPDTPSRANACLVEIVPSTNTFRLANDAGTDFLPPVPGGGNMRFVFNTQCYLSGTGTQVVGPFPLATAEYAAALNLKLHRAFNGPHGVYLMTEGNDGSTSGWVRMGQYTVQSNDPGVILRFTQGAPFIVSTTHVASVGRSMVATGTYGHTGGTGGHYLGYILLLPTPNIQNFNAAGTCLIEYNRISNGLRLIDSAGTGWLGGLEGVPAGEAGAVLSNASCTISVANTLVSIANGSMRVSVPVTYAAGFGPTLGVFTQALDASGKWTDMRQIGSAVSTAATVSRPGPSVTVAVGPALQITATAGASPLAQVHLRISTQISDAPFCHVVWLPPTNTIALIDDAGTGLVAGFVAIGIGTPMSNSQCNVNTTGASVVQSGNQRTLIVPITRSQTFQATPLFNFVNAFDAGGLTTHWRVD